MTTAKKHHVIISGTGRAGTTFLVELMTKLGLDTGYTIDEVTQKKDKNAAAGLEIGIEEFMTGNSAYIVKGPWFCDYMDQILADDKLVIDHVLVPIRDIRAAAESRKRVTNSSDSGKPSLVKKVASNIPGLNKTSLAKSSVPGGLWETSDPDQQEKILYDKLMTLLLEVAKSQVPVSLIHYPSLTKDSKYLYSKLGSVLGTMSFEDFDKVYQATVNPELVHSFTKTDK